MSAVTIPRCIRHPERACVVGLRVSEGSEVARTIFGTCAALIKRLHSYMHGAWIYIMTNSRNTTLYVGVTTNIYNRIWEHRTSQYPESFTARYKLFKLFYDAGVYLLTDAIMREKFIKGKSRGCKINLIDAFNPLWKDLQDQMLICKSR